MPTETTPEEAAYASACLPDRLRCYAATLVLKGHHEQGEFTTLVREAADRLEAADALLSLSARYREAHAAYKMALAAAEDAFTKGSRSWHRLADEQKTAESAMSYAQQALLSAALAIT